MPPKGQRCARDVVRSRRARRRPEPRGWSRLLASLPRVLASLSPLLAALACAACDPAPGSPPGGELAASATPALPDSAPTRVPVVSAAPGAPGAPAISGAPAVSGAREVPILRQIGSGCIPYSAAAVALYHGADVDPLELLRSVPVTKAGVAYADVAARLTSRGLRAEVLHPSIAELRGLLARGLPVVVGQSRSARGDHALVAIRHDPGRAAYAVMDPAQPGLRELPEADVEEAFDASGRQALLIQPAP